MKKQPKPVKAELMPIPTVSKAIIVRQPVSEVLSGLLSANTSRGYIRDLKDFFRTEDLSRVTMDQIVAVRTTDVSRFRDECLAKGLEPGTVARKLSAIRFVYDRLAAIGVMILNPANPKVVRSPKRSTVQKTDFVTWDEAIKILSQPNRAERMGRRDYAMLMMGFNMGMRRHELLGVQMDHLKRGPKGEPYISVRGKGDKDRLIPYGDHAQMLEALAQYLPDRGEAPGYLFPGRRGRLMSGNNFWLMVRKYAEKAGLFERGIHPHTLRSAFITFAFDNGTPLPQIQQTVGHTRGDTTLGYVRDIEMIRSKAVGSLNGLGSKREDK